MLTVGPEPDKFSVQLREDSDRWRSSPAIAIYKDETCFVIGGIGEYLSVKLSSVSCYNIAKDQWEQGTSRLNVSRSKSAACSLGDSVFVFAGDGTEGRVNSVERINVPAIGNDGAAWELIQLRA